MSKALPVSPSEVSAPHRVRFGPAAIFTMLFLSIASGDPCAADGLSRHVPALVLGIPGGEIHMVANDPAPMAYFLKELPADFDPTKLPKEAKDVVIAKVRATMAPASLGGRDQSGVAAPAPRDQFFIRIRILEVRLGSASVDQEYEILFGEGGRDLLYPLTPEQRRRDYVVVMYRDASDAKTRLIGFPVGRAELSEWMAEVSKFRSSPPSQREK